MHWGILGAPKTFYGAWGSRQMPGLPNSTARHWTQPWSDQRGPEVVGGADVR